MDRFNGNRIIALGYLATAAFVFVIGQTAGNVGGLVVIVFLAGMFMNTAQSSLPALAAAFYPTQGRATGVAWMLGFGRFGGIAGSFLVAWLGRAAVRARRRSSRSSRSPGSVAAVGAAGQAVGASGRARPTKDAARARSWRTEEARAVRLAKRAGMSSQRAQYSIAAVATNLRRP